MKIFLVTVLFFFVSSLAAQETSTRESPVVEGQQVLPVEATEFLAVETLPSNAIEAGIAELAENKGTEEVEDTEVAQESEVVEETIMVQEIPVVRNKNLVIYSLMLIVLVWLVVGSAYIFPQEKSQEP